MSWQGWFTTIRQVWKHHSIFLASEANKWMHISFGAPSWKLTSKQIITWGCRFFPNFHYHFKIACFSKLMKLLLKCNRITPNAQRYESCWQPWVSEQTCPDVSVLFRPSTRLRAGDVIFWGKSFLTAVFLVRSFVCRWVSKLIASLSWKQSLCIWMAV